MAASRPSRSTIDKLLDKTSILFYPLELDRKNFKAAVSLLVEDESATIESLLALANDCASHFDSPTRHKILNEIVFRDVMQMIAKAIVKQITLNPTDSPDIVAKKVNSVRQYEHPIRTLGILHTAISAMWEWHEILQVAEGVYEATTVATATTVTTVESKSVPISTVPSSTAVAVSTLSHPSTREVDTFLSELAAERKKRADSVAVTYAGLEADMRAMGALIRDHLVIPHKEESTALEMRQEFLAHMIMFLGSPFYRTMIKETTLNGMPHDVVGIIWKYLGADLREILSYFNEAYRDMMSDSLTKYTETLTPLTLQIHREFRENEPLRNRIKAQIASLEAKDPSLKTRYAALQEDKLRMAAVTSSIFQLEREGYLGNQVSWSDFCRHVLTRFIDFNIELEGPIRVFPATAMLSSNDIVTSDQLKQAGVIVLWSGGFGGPVCMLKQDSEWIRFMVCVGETNPGVYQRELFNKASPRLTRSTKTVALFESKHQVNSARSVLNNSAVNDTLNNCFPLFTASALPENSVVVSESIQKNDWFDTIVLSGDGNLAHHNQREMKATCVLHSGDKKKENYCEGTRSQFQYITHFPQRSHPCVLYVCASHGRSMTEEERSWNQYCVSSNSLLEESITTAMVKEIAVDDQRYFLPSTLVTMETLLAGKTPTATIPSTIPFARSGAYGILMTAIYNGCIIRLNLPLTFKVEVDADTLESMITFMETDVMPNLTSSAASVYLEAVRRRAESGIPLMPASTLKKLFDDYGKACKNLINHPADTACQVEYQRLREMLKGYAPLCADLTRCDIQGELCKVVSIDPLLRRYAELQLEVTNMTCSTQYLAHIASAKATLFSASMPVTVVPSAPFFERETFVDAAAQAGDVYRQRWCASFHRRA